MIKYKAYKSDSQTMNGAGTVSGYFATFDHDRGDSYGDVIRKGAFQKTIAERNATGHPFPLLYNHDVNQIIGKIVNIGEDETGAYFTAELFKMQRAQEIRQLLLSGSIWQCSFAFDVIDAVNIRAGNGERVRELREVKLYEISIVAVPANDRAIVTDVKKTQAETRKSLLATINANEQEKQEKKENLLRYIAKMEKEQGNRRRRP